MAELPLEFPRITPVPVRHEPPHVVISRAQLSALLKSVARPNMTPEELAVAVDTACETCEGPTTWLASLMMHPSVDLDRLARRPELEGKLVTIRVSAQFQQRGMFFYGTSIIPDKEPRL